MDRRGSPRIEARPRIGAGAAGSGIHGFRDFGLPRNGRTELVRTRPRELSPMRGRHESFHQSKQSVDSQSENSGGQRARKNHVRIGEREAFDYRFAETTRSYERRERRRSNRYHRRGAHAGHDYGSSQRKSYPHQSLDGRSAERFRCSNRVGIGITHAGVGTARNGIERVEPERDESRNDSNAKQRDHEREECDTRDRLKDAEGTDHWLRYASTSLETQTERQGKDDS